MESLNSVAANRFLKKSNQNAFYCSVSLTEAYSSLDLNVSFSTFYKYVGDHFKKPHRFNDLCEYCESYKQLKKELARYLAINDYFGDVDDNSEIHEYIKNLFLLRRISE